MHASYSILTYDNNELVQTKCEDLAEILTHFNPARVNWITLSGITLQDDYVTIKGLLNHFQLNPSLLGNIFNHEQQQFEGEYDDCFYLEYAILLYNPARRAHARVKGSIILGNNFLILLEIIPAGLFEKTRQKILNKHTRAQRHRADYLLYLLFKTIVINYQTTLKALIEKFEVLEDEVIGHPGRDFVYDKILDLREEVKPLHSHLLDLDDFVDTVREEESRFISRDTKKNFSKTLARETDDLLAGYQYLRSWITELIEIHRANVNESTNRVMKMLTIMSTIFLPLTFIAGVYGMNFAYMPELTWRWGYPLVLLAMAALAGGALLFMRARKWL